ncbi:hypothetical protein CCR85_11575 [Rhodothalassium salexigens]|uniref:ankyrin repeat domain-containing protein n=2 Tax=Rhodothalassium salexigens TaxID=1086 RepID=UPI0019141C94|nr:ankyrin repeat domain-containing protein [Rhodothalassium salexigens]MBK5912127.1 hypothetical protein [Rhodothalassium salexigens]MBK5921806.1 hypothetical protein [Rhodothalassium salexigens]
MMKALRLGFVLAMTIGGAGGAALLGPAAVAQYSDGYQFIKAVEEDDLLTARQKMFSGATANARNGEGVPVLVMAADNGSLKMTEFLLENGANVNIKDRQSGETALMHFTRRGHLAGVETMLKAGADPDVTDRNGETALMKAARLRRFRVVEALLDAGADVDKTDYTGRTALAYAEENRARNISRALMDAGAR